MPSNASIRRDTAGESLAEPAARASCQAARERPRADACADATPVPASPPVPIVAFCKDWHGDHTSNHHVLRELAKTRRVVWLSSVATRAPSPSVRDLATMGRKLREFARGAVNVEHDLWVATPLVVPLPHHDSARTLNRWLIEAFVRAIRLRLGIERFQLWTFLPTVAEYVGALGEELAVYYCVDEWSMFGYLDREATAAAERALLQRVDVVFAVNDALAGAKRVSCPNTHVSPHGVDHALFATALDPATEVPEDLARLPRPRVGFYGTLREWVDLELLAELARARPRWSIVLIGQELCDTRDLHALPNVHLLGPRPHARLPAYCKGLDAAVIPYCLDERMPYVSPLKLREYLSAGLPVVSTPVPEVTRYAHLCDVAERAAFADALERAMEEDGPLARAARSEAMRGETWEARVAEVARRVDEVVERISRGNLR